MLSSQCAPLNFCTTILLMVPESMQCGITPNKNVKEETKQVNFTDREKSSKYLCRPD